MTPSFATSAMNAEYAQMTEALRWQQQRIIELEAETRELRRQLDDVRRGVGVSLIIEGRHIPLASPPAGPISHFNASISQDDPWTSAAHISRPSAATAPVPTPMPSQRVFPSQPPIHPTAHSTPLQSVPSEYPGARHGETEFPEHAWLTGPTPAVKPTQSAWLQQSHPSFSTPRQETPQSETVSSFQQPNTFAPPTWLSEEAPTIEWEKVFDSAPSSHAQTSAQDQSQSHTSIGSGPAEVWRTEQRQESGKFPTLARITGKRPAVRVPGKHDNAGDMRESKQNPFTDSFVLG